MHAVFVLTGVAVCAGAITAFLCWTSRAMNNVYNKRFIRRDKPCTIHNGELIQILRRSK